MWNTSRDKIEDFLLAANSFHPTIKFTAEISEIETTFLDTKVYKGVRFNKEPILDVRTHFKTTETFQYTLPKLKDILVGKWHLIVNQPQLRNIFKEPPIISYCKGNP